MANFMSILATCIEIYTVLLKGYPMYKKSIATTVLYSHAQDKEDRSAVSHYNVQMESATVDVYCEDRFSKGNLLQQTHSFFEIIYFSKGGLEYLLEDRKYVIHDGDLIFLPPGIIHAPIVSEKNTVTNSAYVMWIHAAFLRTLCGNRIPLDELTSPLLFAAADVQWNFVRKCFTRALKESEEKQPGWELLLHGYAAHLVACVYRAYKLQDDTANDDLSDNLLEQVLDYIQKNIYKKVTIADTAAHFHVSESTISHLLQKEIKISFYRCVKQRKLMESKKLIASDVPIQKVSKMIGYQEYSSFYRAFREEYGISPLQFRKECRYE